jgi:hypothetical protein
MMPLGLALLGARAQVGRARWCSKDTMRGERERDEEERERCHDTSVSVKECVDQGSVRERVEYGGQRRPRD